MGSCFNFFLFYYFLKYYYRSIRRVKNIGNILLLTAHPDDEIFFFYPLLCSYKHIFILCLSSGDFYKKGEIRKSEMEKASKFLNFRYKILDFEDNRNWSKKRIKRYLYQYCNVKKIDTIFTFGKNGVTGHKNHRSCYFAVKGLKMSHIKKFYLREYGKFSKWVITWSTLSRHAYYLTFMNVFKSYWMIIIYWSQMEWYRIFIFLYSNYLSINYYND